MTIKTKFNPGEYCWFISDNRACRDEVTSVHCDITLLDFNLSQIPIEYAFETTGTFGIAEEHCFKTKEELLASL